MKAVSGLKATDVVVGTGAQAARGTKVTIRYSGYLSRGEAFQTGIEAIFTLGRREVIAGLEYGVEGMRVGGVRQLQVSPHLAYREAGIPGVVPPNAKLRFEIELLSAVAGASEVSSAPAGAS